MKRIRILQIITRLILGGAQETAMYTAEKLNPSRYQVEMLSGPQTGSEGSLIDDVRQRGILLTILPELVREINPLKDLSALWKMYRFIREKKFNIIHTHSSKAGILGRIAAYLAGVPVIVHTVHGWSFHNHMPAIIYWIYIILEKLCALFTDALLIVTEKDRAKGINAKIGHPAQYHLVRSAIPLEEFNPRLYNRNTIRHELDLPMDALVLGNIGRFSTQKNPIEWVRVAGMVGRLLPDCRFLLVGDGPLRSQVEAALRDEGLSDKTILTGLRRDPARMMAAMDVFLLTSLWEGLPRVIPQAMLMELPLVATSVDGSSEAIQNGVTGFIHSHEDVKGLAQSCLILLQDSVLRANMGRSGREYAVKEFDIERMVAQIEQLYEMLLSPSTEK